MTNKPTPQYVLMKCDNLLVPVDKLAEIMSVLEGCKPIYKNWNDKSFQFVTDIMSDSLLSFKPFPLAEVARMELDLAEKMSEKS